MPANRWLVPIWIVAGVLVVGLLIAGLGRGDSSPNDGDRGQSTGEAIACASYLVDGTVIEASQSAPDRVSLTMTVSEWLKPQAGPPTLKVTVTGFWPCLRRSTLQHPELLPVRPDRFLSQ